MQAAENEEALLNDMKVFEAPRLQNLVISTSCPAKWLFVDMQTGSVWHKADESQNWDKIGYIDGFTGASLVILPTPHAAIPIFDFRRGG